MSELQEEPSLKTQRQQPSSTLLGNRTPVNIESSASLPQTYQEYSHKKKNHHKEHTEKSAPNIFIDDQIKEKNQPPNQHKKSAKKVTIAGVHDSPLKEKNMNVDHDPHHSRHHDPHHPHPHHDPHHPHHDNHHGRHHHPSHEPRLYNDPYDSHGEPRHHPPHRAHKKHHNPHPDPHHPSHQDPNHPHHHNHSHKETDMGKNGYFFIVIVQLFTVTISRKIPLKILLYRESSV